MTPDKAVDHAMNCLREATPGLPITKEGGNAQPRSASRWFTLGPITDCRTHATETAPGEIRLTVEIGLVTSIQASLTLDEERDTAILRDALNFYATHYGIGGPQRRRNLPPHRTEAGHPNCATCDGGGCPDCTDPA